MIGSPPNSVWGTTLTHTSYDFLWPWPKSQPRQRTRPEKVAFFYFHGVSHIMRVARLEALLIKRLKAPIHKEFLFSPPDCSAIMGTFGPMGVPNFQCWCSTTNAISCRVSYYRLHAHYRLLGPMGNGYYQSDFGGLPIKWS